MLEYPKIETLLNRDPKTFKVIEGQWRLPEFAYLADAEWLFTEKIDGTNVRIQWEEGVLRFGGRTDNAQMPTVLLAELQDFSILNFCRIHSGLLPTSVCLVKGTGQKFKRAVVTTRQTGWTLPCLIFGLTGGG